MKTATLNAKDIAKLLDRQRKLLTIPEHAPLGEIFEEILRIANQFVPSDAGSVFLDDPVLKLQNIEHPQNTELVFVACFGEKAQQLIGERLRADQGIVGKTYLSGEPYISSNVKNDEHFCNVFDAVMDYQTQSLLSVPIKIEASTCGVLEMINRRGRTSFARSDLELLQIFAAYISTSLQNVLDSNRYRELAKRDDLTGLYNDRYFNLRLSEEIDRAEVHGNDLSLIFLDLDHFKSVNDRHGHLVGSQTLRQLATILTATIPPERGVVARYGGDEFVIVVPEADLEEVRWLGEEIRRSIEETALVIDIGATDVPPVHIEGVITASVGVASYWETSFASSDIVARKNEFIRLADQAMYAAKAGGKNRVCYQMIEDDAAVSPRD